MNIMFTRIYAIIVCLGAVLAITVSSGIGLHAIVTAIHPTLLMSPHEYSHLRSNQAWRSNAAMCRNANNVQQSLYEHSRRCSDNAWYQEARQPLSDEEVEGLRATGMALKMSDKRHTAIASLIRVALVLLVSIPIFFVHWRIAQKYDSRSGAAA